MRKPSLKVVCLFHLLISLFFKSITAGDGKSQILCSPRRTREVNGASEKGSGVAVNPGNIAEKVAGTAFSPTVTTTMELRNPVGTLVKSSPASRISPAVPGKVWFQVYACISR